MLSHSSSDLQISQKPKPFTFLAPFQSQFSAHPRFWLFAAFVFAQILIIFLTRNSPHSHVHHFPSETISIPATSCAPAAVPAAAPPPEGGGCEYGRVFVYDLPPMFNRDLIPRNLTDLDPWNWQSGLNINDGLGKRTRALAEILPMNIATAWYQTNQFSSEVIYHRRILNYRCRTTEPESATAFYIPFYAGLAVGKYLWVDDIERRDRLCMMMLRWVQNQTYWKKSNGSDHFLTIGRITWDFRRLADAGKKWGSALLNLPEMEKVTRFTIERASWDDYDVGVPYPTGFHPSTEQQLRQWQRFVLSRDRSRLFSFVGASRADLDGDFRTHLIRYCQNQSDSCRVVDCSVTQCATRPSLVQRAFLSSDFCLQPKGDSSTRRSVFDCMIAGSVPVFFWEKTAYEQYRLFLPEEPESYSVFIDHEKVTDGSASIRGILEKYSKEKIRKMREKVVETIPRLIYARTKKGLGNVKDAFDVAVEGAMKRIKEDKEWNEFVDEIESR
ncbi:unnamed protein product [Cuscuta campestris]|uniref:Exostosin GT47 domain-containing protein n=1 Tax=Cuscuta campestris TaxID=132261 RepID=A0A484KQ02_9ASTE|nr:unnamed protein product [Cuscuta campestris]